MTGHSRQLTVLLGDIDHFKQVNDRYGHVQGHIFLPETDPDEALVVADRLCAAVRAFSLSSPTKPFQVAISIGLVSLPPGYSQRCSKPLEQVDKALYTAKENGRDRVECWHGRRTMHYSVNSGIRRSLFSSKSCSFSSLKEGICIK